MQSIATQGKAESSDSITRIRDELQQKVLELERARKSMQESSEHNRDLVAKNESLQIDVDRVTSALQNEIAQNQERKKKLREYVNNLTAEKKVFEDRCQAFEISGLEAHNKQLAAEQLVEVLESRLGTLKEQNLLNSETSAKECSTLEAHYKSVLVEKDSEISILLKRLEDAKMSTTEEVREAQRQFEEVQREAEAHKSKRITARNEMISLAQALEKAQSEAEEMQSFFQYTLVPLAYDQVTGLETALHSLETASSLVASKRSVQLKSGANSFMQKRLKGRQGGTIGSRGRSSSKNRSRTSSDSAGASTFDECDDSVCSEHELVQPPSFHKEKVADRAEENENGPGLNSGGAVACLPGSIAGSSFNSILGKGSMHIAGISDAMDHAFMLKIELDRLGTGIILLNQSLDRLHEVIRLDRTCCGGVSDLLAALSSGSGVVATAGRSYGYDVISSEIPNDESQHRSSPRISDRGIHKTEELSGPRSKW